VIPVEKGLSLAGGNKHMGSDSALFKSAFESIMDKLTKKYGSPTSVGKDPVKVVWQDAQGPGSVIRMNVILADDGLCYFSMMYEFSNVEVCRQEARSGM